MFIWKKYLFLTFLLVNKSYISESQLENLVKFEDKNFQKQFEVKKQIYKNFFIEYVKKFKKPVESFEEKELFFIREFIKNNNIVNESIIITIKYNLESLKFNEKEVEFDYNNNTLIEYIYDIKVHIEILATNLALIDLQKNSENKTYINEISECIDSINSIYLLSIKKNRKINREINIKTIKCQIKYIPRLEKGFFVSMDSFIMDLIDTFIKLCKLKKNIKNYTKNYLLNLYDFIMYIFNKYEVYLNSRGNDFQTELSILKEITNFYNKNNKKYCLNITNIYDLLHNIDMNYVYSIKFENGFLGNFFSKIKKIDNIYYIYQIPDEKFFLKNNYFNVRKIHDFDKFKKIIIIMSIFSKYSQEKIPRHIGFFIQSGIKQHNLLKAILNNEEVIYY